MNEPKTPKQWQEAVDGANYYLLLDSAIQYGLIKRVPVDKQDNVTKDWWYQGSGVDVDRCVDILERGKKLGYTPKEII